MLKNNPDLWYTEIKKLIKIKFGHNVFKAKSVVLETEYILLKYWLQQLIYPGLFFFTLFI